MLAVNKTDLLGTTDKARQEQWRKLTDRLQASLAQVKGIPIVGFSARTGRGVEKLMPAVARLHAAWNKRVPTPLFNRWLAEAIERNPPPLVDEQAARGIRSAGDADLDRDAHTEESICEGVRTHRGFS
ncbi:MAG: hypothetical protein AB7O88_05645 [Reyranellaceae bacterium]